MDGQFQGPSKRDIGGLPYPTRVSKCVISWSFLQFREGEGAIRIRNWISCFWWMGPCNGFTLICRTNKCAFPASLECAVSPFFPDPFRYQCSEPSALPEPQLSQRAPSSPYSLRLWGSVLGPHPCTVLTFLNTRGSYENIREKTFFPYNTNFFSLHSSMYGKNHHNSVISCQLK